MVTSTTYQTVDTSVDDGDLDLHRNGLVLALFKELREASATCEEETGGGVEVGAELRERGNLAVLCKVELKRTGEFLHDLPAWESANRDQREEINHVRLGRRADTGDRETDVDGRADTTEEQLSLQEDLAVGDGDDLLVRDEQPAS
jgi:hypothetical protein